MAMIDMAEFQFLIGTVKTKVSYAEAQKLLEFQFLIGTVKTRSQSL